MQWVPEDEEGPEANGHFGSQNNRCRKEGMEDGCSTSFAVGSILLSINKRAVQI